jgi:hypothetical protein
VDQEARAALAVVKLNEQVARLLCVVGTTITR